jgi:hypothetical protein
MAWSRACGRSRRAARWADSRAGARTATRSSPTPRGVRSIAASRGVRPYVTLSVSDSPSPASASRTGAGSGCSPAIVTSCTPESGSRSVGWRASDHSISVGRRPRPGRCPSSATVSRHCRSPRCIGMISPRSIGLRVTSLSMSRVATAQWISAGPSASAARIRGSSRSIHRERCGALAVGSTAMISRYTRAPMRSKALCVPIATCLPPGCGCAPSRSSIHATPCSRFVAATIR